MNTENTDNILLTNFQQGNQTAFDKIFRKYYKSLCHFSFKIVKDKESAEEIVQDLFVNLWDSRIKNNITISIKAYLYQAVYNNSIRLVKNKKKFIDSGKLEIEDKVLDFEELMEQSQFEERIYNNINQLPEKCQEIFKLSRFDNLKYKEIAEKLGLSIKTVETQMSRALKFLRENFSTLTLLLTTNLLNFFLIFF